MSPVSAVYASQSLRPHSTLVVAQDDWHKASAEGGLLRLIERLATRDLTFDDIGRHVAGSRFRMQSTQYACQSEKSRMIRRRC
jgi:hypothetical protein